MKALNEKIRFKSIGSMALKEVEIEGKIVGFAKDIKQIFKGEFDALPDDQEAYLVKSIVAGEERGYHVVFPEEII